MNDQEYMSRVQGMERRLYRISHAILWCDADCADAVQEAVFKGWVKRGSLREERYFETWLIRILINECKNLMRRHKIRQVPLEDVPPPAAHMVDLRLRDALQALPEKYRLPLLLHHLEGYNLRETAQMLGITASLAKSRLHQARSALGKLLAEEGDLI